MLSLDASLFQTDRARVALEKYAAVTHLAVRVYDRNERVITASVDSNALFELFTQGREPLILGDCVRRCFAETEASVIITENGHGLAVVGAPFTSSGEVVCAAVAGYALTAHLDQREIRRLARDSGIAFDSAWNVVRKRKELPIAGYRLPLYGELLRIIGETLLNEHHRARQLEETLARLKAADRSKDEFLATLSHELRAPLNTIVGWARSLRAGKLDAAMAAHALEAIERNADAQTRLINDLLDTSRIVAGKLGLDLHHIELIPVLDAAVNAVRPAAEAKNIGLQVALDPSVGKVSGDSDRLGQIFSNLLSNAVKFTPAGGKITVHLGRMDSEAKVTVSDTGQGISSDFLPHIFERFRQADNTITRAHGGLGLGLAIVQRLVELHGGTVRADSRGEGQGATFTVTLSLLNLPLEPREEPKPSISAPPGIQSVQVWVVDDDAGGRTMLKMLLEMSGAQVTALSSAYEALKMLDDSRPQILVCDISMPGMDGYTLMRQVRARGPERGGNVPAIAVTGYATPEHCERALSAGYQTYLPKPIDLDALARAIASLAEHEL